MAEFRERARGAMTACSGYSHSLCCQLNPWKVTDVFPYPEFLCLPHRKFCPAPYLSNSPQVGQGCSNSVHSSSMVGQKIDLGVEILYISSANFDFSKYCCSFAVKKQIFSEKATALKLCTAENVNSIIQYTWIALRVHSQLQIIHATSAHTYTSAHWCLNNEQNLTTVSQTQLNSVMTVEQ